MNDSKILELRDLVKAVSVKALVKYFNFFETESVDRLKIEMKTNENWSEKSINSRISKGRKIFSEYTIDIILELLISSKSDSESINQAIQIYSTRFPNKQPKTIRFIRPEFVFDKEIVHKLFVGYEIIHQYPINNHFIDWYLPELKLAIEYDERHHLRSKDDDIKRQQEISQLLDCKFIRFKE